MRETREILITGASGQLGVEIQRCLWPAEWKITALDRNALDLRDPAAIATTIAAGHWAAVINCAAYTKVDMAEEDVVTAWAVNALAPAAFGEACARARIPIIHVSTDYVFSGDKTGPWGVDDQVNPLNVYGASKLGGELAIRTSGARHVIVRTAWVVSSRGQNFVRTMLRLATERETVNVVDDQHGSPTSAADLAQALSDITIRMVEDATTPSATLHFTNAGAVSWAGFAREIFEQSCARGGPVANVVPVTTKDYPTPARRPANSHLAHDAITHAYGITPRAWQSALSDIMDELIGVPK